ncbi:hypothetical protein R1flu_016267 [Riccia fluitans]|uniref:Rab-GAP TBC domain-containing protein n=1 Tax=Riccia fluitans TaxID=41844 RepID=A0ABD1YLV3_9MARC
MSGLRRCDRKGSELLDWQQTQDEAEERQNACAALLHRPPAASTQEGRKDRSPGQVTAVRQAGGQSKVKWCWKAQIIHTEIHSSRKAGRRRITRNESLAVRERRKRLFPCDGRGRGWEGRGEREKKREIGKKAVEQRKAGLVAGLKKSKQLAGRETKRAAASAQVLRRGEVSSWGEDLNNVNWIEGNKKERRQKKEHRPEESDFSGAEEEDRTITADWDASPWSCAGAIGQKSAKAATAPQEDPASTPSFSLPPLRSPKQRSAKSLKPEKWRAAFDHEGRPVGFQKLLKIIALGGVEQSIRAEVWEFLLGCYALGTTAEYRDELRAARRERYKRLIEQCQHMHPSIGTGSLAYTVGTKVMDVRIMSKDSARKEAKLVHLEVKEASKGKAVVRSTGKEESSSPIFDLSGEFDKTSPSKVSAEFESLYEYNGPSHGNAAPARVDSRHEDLFGMPVTNLFADREEAEMREETETREDTLDDTSTSFGREHLPGQVDSDSVGEIEPGFRNVRDVSSTAPENKPKRIFASDVGPLSWPAGSMKRIKSRLVRDRRKKERAMKIGDSTRGVIQDVHSRQSRKQQRQPCTPVKENSVESETPQDPVAVLGKNANEERVAEWLWILHKIVVDVVRTDRHLEFYGDVKNMARMSDILAVYAWIDPATGYCQGMSDLLSPFIVLFEDDADAFWCFESLLRRVRPNFQMEGPVGVMKQLEALPRIMEVADLQMYRHLSAIGADNFLFAFRMLLVLFRRELSFGESLSLWEMMWAADFNQAIVWALEYSCLDALVLNMPSPFTCTPEREADNSGCDDAANVSQYGTSPRQDYASAGSASPNASSFGGNFLARSPFCGLRPGNLLSKNRQRMPTVRNLIGRNGDEELAVFCVAAILVHNRNKLLKEVQSMDDAIKLFNDMNLTIRVHSSMHTAIKLRKKYRSRTLEGVVLGEITTKRNLLCLASPRRWLKNRTLDSYGVTGLLHVQRIFGASKMD